ncbi:hypothetical protein Agub_g15440, partial [Astrephomene gubernaculifera]
GTGAAASSSSSASPGSSSSSPSSGGPLLCWRLGDVAPTGTELCREAGFTVAPSPSETGEGDAEGSGEPACFDGTPTYSTHFCEQPPPPPQQRQQARRKAAAAGSGGGGAAGEGSALLGAGSRLLLLLAAGVAAGAAWLGYLRYVKRRGMMQALMQDARPPPSTQPTAEQLRQLRLRQLAKRT